MSGFGSAYPPRRTYAPTTPTMIGGIILFLAILVVVIIYAEVIGRDAYSNMEHAEDIILSEREINIALLDMETGMRGFVIVKDEAFLEPYNAAVKRLPTLWTS